MREQSAKRRPRLRLRPGETLEARSMLDGSLVISELMAVNSSTIADSDGQFSDWIEIHNTGNAAVNLGGWHLTDDATSPDKWTFPSQTLSAGGYLVVFASGKNRAIAGSELHTNFSLSSDGEYLALTRPDESIATSYDPFPALPADASYGIESGQITTSLVAPGAATKALVPTSNALQATWNQPGFSDAPWLSGASGVGYDRGTSLQGLVGLDLLSSGVPAGQRIDTNGDGTNENNSVYTRTTFNVANPADFNGLNLDMKYDDGFVAYLNGQEVARSSAPAVVDWNSSATAEHATGEVMMAITYDASGTIKLYRNGQFYGDGSQGALASYPGGIADVLIGVRHEDISGGTGSETGVDQFLAGFVDEARIYNTALSPAQLQAIYSQGPVAGAGSTADPALLHQWTFNSGANDVVGGANGTLFGGAAVSGGRLALDGVNDYMRSQPLPATITTKTLISWVSLKNLTQQAGSALTIENPTGGDVFDGIVYAERVSNQWMAGSNGFTRSVPNNGGAAETQFDGVAPAFERFDISAHLGSLVAGQNVLAIQALNVSATNNDMLVLPQLSAVGEPASGQIRFFPTATPGQANHDGVLGFVTDTNFSLHRGFYSQPIDVGIATSTLGATIRYTTDGSAPTDTHGTIYTGPVHITTTTTLRAAAFLTGYAPTNIDTETYIFVADVIHQPNLAPLGAHWDTEMDPEVVNNNSQTFSVAQALVAIPTVSLVMDNADLFGPNGIYQNPTARGDAWMRGASVEYFYPDSYTGYRVGDGFNIDAGLTITGDAGRDPYNPKHSFRIAFKSEFGPSKLEYPLFEGNAVTQFDTLMLRTGHNQGWATGYASSEFTRDQFSRDLQLAMGQGSADGKKVHLYLNGLYWGMYDLTEKPDSSFSAEHFGGNKDDYDELTGATAVPATQADLAQGDRTAWNAMFAIAAGDMTTPSSYAAIKQYLDIDNLIDYVISLQVTGEQDAPTCICETSSPRNFFATRLREAGGVFRFFRWDAEFTLQDPGVDVSDRAGYENPALLHSRLRDNPEYRLRFADHVQKAMFDDGPLTVANLTALYARRTSEIDQAVVAESARWGDSKTAVPFTRDGAWIAETTRIATTYFTQRRPIVLAQFAQDGLFPAITAPAYSVNGQPQHGGQISLADQIAISAASGGVYYTTDGSDPRVAGVSPVVTTLVAEGSSVRALVPTGPAQEATWYLPGTSDASWLSGTGGVGYDRGVGLGGFIGLDLLSPSIPAGNRIDTNGDGTNENNSVYTRSTFNVTNPADYASLTLNARYDDGFVAYLNGQEVARANAPTDVHWNSAATADRGAGEVMIAITYASNGAITIYRDGQLYASAASTSQGSLQTYPAGVADVLIGARHIDAAGGSGTENGADPFLAGFVDEARVYNQALSAAQIQAIFAAGPVTGSGATADPALLHQWTFNSGTATDVVGGVTGTLLGGASIDGGRLSLDGVNDYMRSQPLPANITTKTLVSWVSLKNLSQQAGSALTIENPTNSDVFDGIVFAERVPQQWMAGSDGFQRSVANNGGASETLVDVPVSQFATFDLSAHLNKLVAGQNVLAIQALNSSLTSSDMLISAKLEASNLPPSGISPTASLYTGPLNVSTSTTIKSRALSGGVWSPLQEATFFVNVPASAANLAIVEINYHPSDPTTAELGVSAQFDQDSFEFLEFQNTSNVSIDLAGVELTQGVTFDFDTSSVHSLAPGQRIILVRSVLGFQTRYGTQIPIAGVYSGRLADGGEALTLVDHNGDVIQDFAFDDEGSWPERADGKGSTLEAITGAGNPGDSSYWRASTQYYGSPAAASLAPLHTVVVNEVLSRTTAPTLDAVELFNTTAAAIDIGGWYLSDGSTRYLKYQIPLGTILPAGGYLTIDESQFNPTPLTPGPNDFSFNGPHGERAVLVTAQNGLPQLFVDDISFDAVADGQSLGRWTNGSGELYPMTTPTFGSANSGPAIGPVIISEVGYTAFGNLQFVELFNTTSSAVDLALWALDKGVTFNFPSGSSLPAHAAVVVVPFNPATQPAEAAAFRSTYGIGAGVSLVGPFTGTLSANGERVRLARPDTPPVDEPAFTPYVLVDEVNYATTAPWPTVPSASESLTRSGATIYGNEPTNWSSSTATPGLFANQVAARHVFYNNSKFDGNDTAAGASDDLAIAVDKAPLLPGAGAATLANYSSYSRGINGVMIDIDTRGVTPVAADFTLHVGNDNSPAGWAVGPTPTISMRAGAGASGTDRITLTWADGAIKNQWLEVRFVSAAMGLAAADVFYFGNAVGESGSTPGNAQVNSTDEIGARTNPKSFLTPATIGDAYDFNRDGFVNATDQILSRSNSTTLATSLKLISVPANFAPLTQAVAAPSLAASAGAEDGSLASLGNLAVGGSGSPATSPAISAPRAIALPVNDRTSAAVFAQLADDFTSSALYAAPETAGGITGADSPFDTGDRNAADHDDLLDELVDAQLAVGLR